jgi:hypothetical protein
VIAIVNSLLLLPKRGVKHPNQILSWGAILDRPDATVVGSRRY